MPAANVVLLADFCKAQLDLELVRLENEYKYHSLPFCVIDTVFSIGARYASTEKTVARFCDYFQLPRISLTRPPRHEQFTISAFIKLHERFSSEQMAVQVYRNRQRTSTRSGILKAEAALRFAQVLQAFGVETFEDAEKVIGNRAFEQEIAQIPGQRSGISTRYFYMLAGDENYIKPDRMIARFIWSALGQKFSVEDSHALIIQTHQLLSIEFPHLTPRSLDHAIWLFQREQPA